METVELRNIFLETMIKKNPGFIVWKAVDRTAFIWNGLL